MIRINRNKQYKVVLARESITLISKSIRYTFDGIWINNFFFPYHSVTYLEITEIEPNPAVFRESRKDPEISKEDAFYLENEKSVFQKAKENLNENLGHFKKDKKILPLRKKNLPKKEENSNIEND